MPLIWDSTVLGTTQLRAILRASAFGPAKVLFPMISTIEEVRQIRGLFELTKKDLHQEGILFDESIPFGVMIEVPSAASWPTNWQKRSISLA